MAINNQKHLLQQPAGNNPILTARTKFDRETLPTMLEIRVGGPATLKAISSEAQTLKGFCERAKEAIKSVGETHFRIDQDRTLNEAAKLVRSATHAEMKIKTARTEFGRAAEKAVDRLKVMEAELRTTLRPPPGMGEALIDHELRAMIRAETDVGKQLAMVRSDPAMRAAAARAPAVSSGLNAEVHAGIQSEHMAAVLPEQFEIFEDLKESFKAADTALRAIESQAKELVDFETAQALDSRKFVEV